MQTEAGGPRPGQRIPNGMIEENYPRNHWWVAAFSAEVAAEPVARTLLGLPVVLYRQADGTVNALDDRCPHRWAPLSAGKVEGDEIVCPYHGIRFAGDGRCTKIPTQDVIPATVRVTAYPLHEVDGLIWIWMGDPARALLAPPPPPHEFLTAPGWTTIWGYFRLASNYMLLRENVLDLTHFPFVHGASFNQLDWLVVPEVTSDEDSVTYRAEFRNSPLSPVFAAPMGLEPGAPHDRAQTGTMKTLALSYSIWDVTACAPADGYRARSGFHGLHITTPISPDETHYYWTASFDSAEIDAERLEQFRAAVCVGFEEDVELLGRIQAHVRADARSVHYPEAVLGADKAGIAARRLLKRYLDRDATVAAAPLRIA